MSELNTVDPELSAPAAKKSKPKKATKPKKAKKPAKSKSKATKPKKAKPAKTVERSERLDLRLGKKEKAKLLAKAKASRRTVTSIVMELIEKMK